MRINKGNTSIEDDKLTSWSDSIDVGEQLALCNSRVPHEENIDVPPDLHAMGGAVDSPHQKQK